jgi:5-methyltetrahydrofolate corrinoid/iron sulfur protein methyltransferase
MILVAENLNIMSNTLGPALRERQSAPVQAMAAAEHRVDIDYLDLNIGPAPLRWRQASKSVEIRL